MIKNYKHVMSKEIFGHSNLCPFKNTSGPSCDCEHSSDAEIAKAMTMMGWEASVFEELRDDLWSRTFGEHVVTVSRVIDGWMIRWQKGPGFTFFEKRGFGTIGHLMSWMWGTQADRLDETLITAWEHSAMRAQLKKLNVKPAESKRR